MTKTLALSTCEMGDSPVILRWNFMMRRKVDFLLADVVLMFTPRTIAKVVFSI
jgi:hypothetical protein